MAGTSTWPVNGALQAKSSTTVIEQCVSFGSYSECKSEPCYLQSQKVVENYLNNCLNNGKQLSFCFFCLFFYELKNLMQPLNVRRHELEPYVCCNLFIICL